MPLVLKHTNVILSRAGASSIAEITALGIPSILIPSPYVTHNHQLKNAKSLAEKNATVIIEEENYDKRVVVDMIDSIYQILRALIDGDQK